MVARDSDPGHNFASVVLASLNREGCGQLTVALLHCFMRTAKRAAGVGSANITVVFEKKSGSACATDHEARMAARRTPVRWSFVSLKRVPPPGQAVGGLSCYITSTNMDPLRSSRGFVLVGSVAPIGFGPRECRTRCFCRSLRRSSGAVLLADPIVVAGAVAQSIEMEMIGVIWVARAQGGRKPSAAGAPHRLHEQRLL